MPRTQVTICGAPKAMAIPRIAPRHHPHDILPAMAMAPSPMTRMIAMGVSQAKMFVCSAVAPVMKGDAACANTSDGGSASKRNRAPRSGSPGDFPRLTSMMSLRDCPGVQSPSRVRARALTVIAAPRIELVPLLPPGCAEPEALHDKRVVVLLFALLVRPVAGADLCFEDQLIALARVSRDRLPQRTESHEPQAGHHFLRSPLFVLARVVIAHEAELRVALLSLLHQLRVAREISDRSQCETVHRPCSSPRVLVWRRGGTV